MRAEILAPAGDEACARAAIDNGADAVYLGLARFSARREAANFGDGDFTKLTTYAHLLGAKVYVCLNTLVKDGELPLFFEEAKRAWEGGADALLLQDMLLGKALKERYPFLTLHLSTQAGCCNERGALLAKECGFSRAVLARETPLSEIGKIAKIIETEVFVQGALCTCFSGQCYLSSFAGNNSGNRGLCKQPCRKKYSLDRAGFQTPAYALSLSDLSVGERVGELLSAGVVSLKIEGRMRRPEYVAAAVRYYRAVLAGEPSEGALSDLKRAYNRGDYTKGLAFGQENLLSRRVQGHIGEAVGIMQDGSFCKSRYPARAGDGFKLLRGGEEVGGARFLRSAQGGFFLSSPQRPLRGDEVRLTTDSSLPARVKGERKREIALFLRFVAGEKAEAVCGDFRYTGDVLAPALRAPLTEEELKTCFSKTDGLPFAVRFVRTETENAFLPKSALNAFRRAFFEALSARLLPRKDSLDAPFPAPSFPLGKPRPMTALIAEDLRGLKADLLIWKPRDFSALKAAAAGEGKKFLFLPPFFTGENEAEIASALPFFDGIYCDGYYGLSLAKTNRMLFFAGTGWNLSNRIAVAEAKKAGADYFALSKELSLGELNALSCEGAFALTLGAVKVMDLLYCPFGRTCASCDKRDRYTLTDEEGRAFPLRRYVAGECRFELFNCAPLKGMGGAFGALADLTLDPSAAPYAACPEQASLPGATRGHFNRSLL